MEVEEEDYEDVHFQLYWKEIVQHEDCNMDDSSCTLGDNMEGFLAVTVIIRISWNSLRMALLLGWMILNCSKDHKNICQENMLKK